MTADAFYVPLGGERFLSTPRTVGPWSADAQHMGPPAALIGRAMQRCEPRDDTVLTKVTLDILGPVPVAEVEVTATVLRTGRSVELIGAELRAGGRAVVRGTGWRLARRDTAAVAADTATPLAFPDGIDTSVDSAPADPTPPGWVQGGYLASIEWLWPGDVAWAQRGPATVWGRMRHALVEGEEPTGVCRVLTVADCGNGLSAPLDPNDGWLFPNTDLTVHFSREPHGEWIGIEAATTVGPDGVGVATTVLHDRAGAVARGAQILTVRRR